MAVELVNELQTNGQTYVGALTKNKRKLPAKVLPNNSRERPLYLRSLITPP